MQNSLCVSPPGSIYLLPKWKENDKFAYSATDVLSWVHSESTGLDPDSWLRTAIANDKNGREDLRIEERDGLSSIDDIRSLYRHTEGLAIRFKLELDGKFPSYPKKPLMPADAIDKLSEFKTILNKVISTERYKSRNEGFYQLALSLRGYAATLQEIIWNADGVYMTHDYVHHWADGKRQHLVQCRKEIDCVTVVSWPESISSNWRETVADVGDLARQILKDILNAYDNSKVDRWEPDKVIVTRIREAMKQIGGWSIVFSLQADELPTTLPTLAAKASIAERDAPAGESKKRGGRPPLANSTKPEEVAKRKIYGLIRKQKQAKPESGPLALLQHFRDDKGFKSRLTDAGMRFDEVMFIAALKWIERNPIANT